RSILAGLAERNSADAGLRADLALSDVQIGFLDASAGRTAPAERAYQRALAVQEALVAEHPATIDYRRQLAGTINRPGSLYRDDGRPEAADALKKVPQTIAALVERHPQEPSYRQELAGGYLNLGLCYQSNRRHAEAEATYAQALEHWRRLATEH